LQSEHVDLAMVWGQESRQQTNGGGFSGAVGTEKPIDAAARNGQVQLVDRHPVAKTAHETLGDNGSIGFFHLGSSTWAGRPAGKSDASEDSSTSARYTSRLRSRLFNA